MLECKEADAMEKQTAFLQVFDTWPHAVKPEDHLQQRLASIQHRRAAWFVGLLSGSVVCSLGAYPYSIFGPGEARAARIFGAVYTRPDARGQGYAQQLLRWVMQHFSRNGVRDFLLFSDIDPAYYERLGFRRLPSWQWSWSVPEGRPALSRPLKRIALTPQRLDTLHFRYGILRSDEDAAWVLKKQAGHLQLSVWNDAYWILSQLAPPHYHLLESNLPQDAAHWQQFRDRIHQDAQESSCREVRGWWTAPANEPDASQPEIRPRQEEILMWASLHDDDPWQGDREQHGFRVFASEHV